jgi:hypothetical protein
MDWGRRFNRPWFWIVAPIVLLVLVFNALLVRDETPTAYEVYEACLWKHPPQAYADGDPRQKIESAKLHQICGPAIWWDHDRDGPKFKWRWQR